MPKPRESKAWFIEIIESECPYCEKEYRDREPGWRDKAQENGKSFTLVRCQNPKCRKPFRLNYLK